MLKATLISVFIFICLAGLPQTYSLQFTITDQPENQIILGSLHGDKFNPLDSINGEVIYQGNTKTRKVVFQFTKNNHPGMYRIIMGQTLLAKVMNEPPQQLDFIFNNENIIIETDFNQPEDSIIVVESLENKAWFSFKKEERNYTRKLNRLMQYINSSPNNKSEIQQKRDEYNMAMLEKESFISNSIQKNKNLFAAKIMPLYREPILDSYLSENERIEAYKKEYFNNLDFSDPDLINTTYYTDKAIHYIQAYGKYGLTREEQEKEFIKAVDIVLANVNKNQLVYEHILDYIVRGFERLGLDKALIHIADNYAGTTCQTDEKTTLERKLEAQKIKPGTEVPDFIMNDLNGDPVTLSEVLKERTLLLFWASWCPHCNLMIPELKKWIDRLNSKNIEVVAISLDTSKKDWQNKVFELGIEAWYNLSDLKEWEGEVTTEYNIYATPTMFLLDNKRNILGKPLTLNDLKLIFKQ